MHTTAAVSESKPVRAAWLAQPSFAKDLFRTALSPERGGRAGKGEKCAQTPGVCLSHKLLGRGEETT